MDFTAQQDGTVSVSYDYRNSSGSGMYAGQLYYLLLSVNDQFWSTDSNIILDSLTVTSTISQPSFSWSVSTHFTAGGEYLGTSYSAPLNVEGNSMVGAMIPYADTFALDLTSTMVFSGVTAGDIINIDLPDTTEDDPAPEPATVSMAGLAVAACALLKRRLRARA